MINSSIQQRLSPLLLEWTAYLHCAIGVVLFYDILQTIGSNGVFNAIAGHYDRGFAFWFLFSGALMWVTARLMRWVVNELGAQLPVRLGWHLIILSAAGAFILPLSGFWLVLLQGIILALGRNR
jgi:hypothetical protein